MPSEAYDSARKDGLRQVQYCNAHGLSPYPEVLDTIAPGHNHFTCVPLGIIRMDINRIGGTVTEARTNAFSPDFLPLPKANSEFAMKWSQLYESVIEKGMQQPVTALEYYGKYYILEGNKRVSVMRRLNAAEVEAEVKRIIPDYEDSERYRVYQEYLQFYKDTHISNIYFQREGSFKMLCAMAEQKVDVRWDEDSIMDLSSAYARFGEIYYSENKKRRLPLELGGTFLMMVRLFGYRDVIDSDRSWLADNLHRIIPEMTVAASDKPVSFTDEPTTKQQSVLSLRSIFKSDGVKLRCGFLYNSTPDRFGWTYWHELGRHTLERHFGGSVTTTSCNMVDPSEADLVVNEWIESGISVIFAASPVFQDVCMRQAILHPEAHILICSPSGFLGNVRSYYLKQYEAKFILGAMAGAVAENDLIGYIAEYPILTTPACINAFALGASLTNPRAQIVLDWSTLIDHDPEKALMEDGVSVISGRDRVSPDNLGGPTGLYKVTDGEPQLLAMPIMDWGSFYCSIVSSILSGGWEHDKKENMDRRMQYYAGLSMGAVSVSFADELPTSVRRLGEILRDDIAAGRIGVFEGPVIARDGTIRIERGHSLTPAEIIDMNYLTDKVTGRIPKPEELDAVSVETARMLGLDSNRRFNI